jgi:uncharacterized protein with PQ loop repeat
MKSSPFLEKISAHGLFERYFLFIGTAGHLFFYLQAFKIFTSECVAGLSLPAFLVSFVAIGHWVIYGFIKRLPSIFYSNSFGLVGLILVLIGIIIYQ